MTIAELLSHDRARGARRGRADVATGRFRDAVGSWRFLGAAAAAVGTGGVLAVRHDNAGVVAIMGLVLSAFSTLGLVVVLMVAGRDARGAERRAMHDVESARRTAAAIADLRADVDGLRGDVVRISAGVPRPRPTSRS